MKTAPKVADKCYNHYRITSNLKKCISMLNCVLKWKLKCCVKNTQHWMSTNIPIGITLTKFVM